MPYNFYSFSTAAKKTNQMQVFLNKKLGGRRSKPWQQKIL